LRKNLLNTFERQNLMRARKEADTTATPPTSKRVALLEGHPVCLKFKISKCEKGAA
jgi:hypothetical protein